MRLYCIAFAAFNESTKTLTASAGYVWAGSDHDAEEIAKESCARKYQDQKVDYTVSAINGTDLAITADGQLVQLRTV